MLRAGLAAEGELFTVTYIKLRLVSCIGMDLFVPSKNIFKFLTSAKECDFKNLLIHLLLYRSMEISRSCSECVG